MVPTTGFEPVRCYSLVPETSASANSATWALCTNIAHDKKASNGGAEKQVESEKTSKKEKNIFFAKHSLSRGVDSGKVSQCLC